MNITFQKTLNQYKLTFNIYNKKVRVFYMQMIIQIMLRIGIPTNLYKRFSMRQIAQLAGYKITSLFFLEVKQNLGNHSEQPTLMVASHAWGF